MKTYAGIGSRKTPPDVISMMRAVAFDLALKGWTLRSGCAQGADSAFEEGAWQARDTSANWHQAWRDSVPRPELFLPWARFEGRRKVLVARESPQAEAFEIAAQFHPAWASLKQGARALHARNVHQILGPDVTAPTLSRFVICWTNGARGEGGTGQALRIARHYGVTVFDLADPRARSRVQQLWS